MTTETARTIAAAAEKADLQVALRINYSGRGMFGERTTGLIIGSLGEFAAAVAIAAGAAEDAEDFADDLRNLRQDSMGRDTIVY